MCETGRWKNHQAFSDHYIRLNAIEVASKVLYDWVHNDSLGQGAEHDWSRTPLTEEMGGRDQEGEAQRLSEPTLPLFDIEMSSSSEEEIHMEKKYKLRTKSIKTPGFSAIKIPV